MSTIPPTAPLTYDEFTGKTCRVHEFRDGRFCRRCGTEKMCENAGHEWKDIFSTSGRIYQICRHCDQLRRLVRSAGWMRKAKWELIGDRSAPPPPPPKQ